MGPSGKGIFENLQDQVTDLRRQNEVLQAQVYLLATLCGADVRKLIEEGRPVTHVELGLVQRGDYFFRPEDAPKIEKRTPAEKLETRELSPSDLDDDLEEST